MPFHHSDPRWYPSPFEERPTLYVPSYFLLSADSVEITRRLVLFYDRFRRREAFDNHSEGRELRRVDLDDIYDCYVAKYMETVVGVRDGDIGLETQLFERKAYSPLGRKWFKNRLYHHDQSYMERLASPPRSRSDFIDNLPLWNKHDPFDAIKPFIERSDPVLVKIDRSPRGS